MILDADSTRSSARSSALLEDGDDPEHVKPELLESVLEIATPPAPTSRRPARQLRALRAQVARGGRAHGLRDRLGGHASVRAAGRTSASSRARRATATSSPRCASSPARSSSSACTSTSGSTIPRRRSTSRTGCASTCRCCSRCRRTRRSGAATRPACRRRGRRSSAPSRASGMPPHYDGWDDFERRIGFMVEAGVIDDYTYLWYDVRPHPNLGTVEIRVMDAQTRVEHTLGARRADPGDGAELAEHFEAGRSCARYPHEMLDENSGSPRGTGSTASSSTCPRRAGRHARARAAAAGPARAARRGARVGRRSGGVGDLIERGNGAERQRVVYEANHDFARGRARDRRRDRAQS